jgi:DNA-binding PadR family transcriptional regulator
MKITRPVAAVLAAFLQQPDADRYGLELMRATSLSSGRLYPILVRLQEAGWVQAQWEKPEPDRLARRYYRLTPDGAAAVRHEFAAQQQKRGISGRIAEGGAR